MKRKAWTGRTGGNRWMQETLVRLFEHLDSRWAMGVVALWIMGSFVFQPRGTRGSWRYWRRRQHRSVLGAVGGLWQQYWAFGHVILDRFAAFAGQSFRIEVEDEEQIMARLQQGESGFIVLSSHVGNQELAGYFIDSRKPMQVVIYLGDTATVNAHRERMFAEHGLHFIPVEPDGSHIFEMHQALQRGEVLSIHGDRLFEGDRSMLTPLLGEDAPFPEGPFRMAATERVPVVTMFMVRTGHNAYRLQIKRLSREGDEALTRDELKKALLERFACEIEQQIRKRPEQWFHFYDFWA